MIVPEEIAKVIGDLLHDLVVIIGKDISHLSDVRDLITKNTPPVAQLVEAPPEIMKYIAAQQALREALFAIGVSVMHNSLVCVKSSMEELKIENQLTEDQWNALNKQIKSLSEVYDNLKSQQKMKKEMMEKVMKDVMAGDGDKYSDMMKNFMDLNQEADS